MTWFCHHKRSRDRKTVPEVGRPEFLTPPTNVALMCRKRSAELSGRTKSTFPSVMVPTAASLCHALEPYTGKRGDAPRRPCPWRTTSHSECFTPRNRMLPATKLALGLWPGIKLWLSRLQLNQTPVVQLANRYYRTPDSGTYQPGIT